MNTIEDIFSEYAERITDSAKEQKSTFIQYCKGISSLIPDSFYVLDIVQKQFIHIKPDNLFLCGHSVKEAMELGYDFFPKIGCCGKVSWRICHKNYIACEKTQMSGESFSACSGCHENILS